MEHPISLLPARMLNEYAYCPRLAYLEFVQGEFAPNEYTEDGSLVHRRVDEESGEMPRAEEDDVDRPRVVRSVMLSAPDEDIIARIDLVECEGLVAVPVDYKRGKKPDLPEGAWEPDRVQVCAQALVLRANGYVCDRAVVYYAGSKDRVSVPIDDPLIARTREIARRLREMASSEVIPPPLDASPKCDGCSLVGICLPDEVTMLAEPVGGGRTEPRRLVPARDDALPLYVQTPGAFVGKSGDVLVVKLKGEKLAETRMFETSHVCLFGAVQISTQAVAELCRREIPIVYCSSGGWLYGIISGSMHKNVELRLHQYRAAVDERQALALARRFVAAKVRNCRTMLRRNAEEMDESVLRRLSVLADDAAAAESAESLLGLEGTAARVYFESLPLMIKQGAVAEGFSFEGRNRRPPKDPVNSLLSFAYSMLAKDLTIAIAAAGFDPFLGFYHRPRYGRPSLALDLMEEFRPIVADSTVIGAINTGVIGADDFTRVGGGVSLKPNARKAFIAAYERRMDQLVTHPVFGYQISYRRVLDVQARLLGRHLSGEIADYPSFLTR